MSEVRNFALEDPVPCPCGCGAEAREGALLRNGHPRGCLKASGGSCVPCRNRRNRGTGKRKQRQARRLLGVPDAKTTKGLAHEEAWRGEFRVEVKAGAQVAPVATRFLAMEAQSAAAKAEGDPRPFLAVAMPDGWGNDGVVMLRASRWRQHIVPLIEDAGGVA